MSRKGQPYSFNGKTITLHSADSTEKLPNTNVRVRFVEFSIAWDDDTNAVVAEDYGSFVTTTGGTHKEEVLLKTTYNAKINKIISILIWGELSSEWGGWSKRITEDEVMLFRVICALKGNKKVLDQALKETTKKGLRTFLENYAKAEGKDLLALSQL